MKQIKKFELFCEGREDTQLNWILDKINKFGEKNLSKSEKEYLDNVYDSSYTPERKPNPHYNRYITKLLNDLKSKEITEDIAKQFIEKYVSKEDLFSVLLQLLRDGKLDILLNGEKINDTNDE